jgi:hypothetical protein
VRDVNRFASCGEQATYAAIELDRSSRDKARAKKKTCQPMGVGSSSSFALIPSQSKILTSGLERNALTSSAADGAITARIVGRPSFLAIATYLCPRTTVAVFPLTASVTAGRGSNLAQ